MSKKSIGSAAVPATQAEMATAEQAFLNELPELMQAWYDQAGPGVDVVFYALSQLLTAGDEAAAAFNEDFDQEAIPARWAAVEAMRGALPVAWPQSIMRSRELRKKILKRAGVTDGDAYQRRTLSLVAADIIPVWYAEGGLWGALASLNEACNLAFEVITRVVDDSTVSDEKKLHIAALEIRHRLGVMPAAELELLEAVSKRSTAVA